MANFSNLVLYNFDTLHPIFPSYYREVFQTELPSAFHLAWYHLGHVATISFMSRLRAISSNGSKLTLHFSNSHYFNVSFLIAFPAMFMPCSRSFTPVQQLQFIRSPFVFILLIITLTAQFSWYFQSIQYSVTPQPLLEFLLFN